MSFVVVGRSVYSLSREQRRLERLMLRIRQLLLATAIVAAFVCLYASSQHSARLAQAHNLASFEDTSSWTVSQTPVVDMTTAMTSLTRELLAATISSSSNSNNNGLKSIHSDAGALGHPVMPSMGNSTLRAELGRSTWRLLHTMASRFPAKPSPEQVAAYELFVVLLSKLYPCGNCAAEFQNILSRKPPSFPSRDAAVMWTCGVHNTVNTRLGKPEFNCSQALNAWQCGCADEFQAK